MVRVRVKVKVKVKVRFRVRIRVRVRVKVRGDQQGLDDMVGKGGRVVKGGEVEGLGKDGMHTSCSDVLIRP